MLPIIASLLEAGLGILGGAVAAKGKDLIQDKLGIDIEKMLGTPEGKIELLKIQTAHEEALQSLALEASKLDFEKEKLEQANTDNARHMQEVALNQSDIFSKRFVYYFAIGWSLFSVLYIGFITFVNIPAPNVRFADTILGFILGTVIATIVNFFFGSSKQSQAKDAALAEAIKGIKQ